MLELKNSPDETPVACVIVSEDGEILSSAHNKFPPGIAVTEERLENDVKANYTIHAEVVAVTRALASHPEKLKGATAYVANKCVCLNCANLLIEVGVGKVVCPSPDTNTRWVESNKQALANLEESGVTIRLSSSPYSEE